MSIPEELNVVVSVSAAATGGKVRPLYVCGWPTVLRKSALLVGEVSFLPVLTNFLGVTDSLQVRLSVQQSPPPTSALAPHKLFPLVTPTNPISTSFKLPTSPISSSWPWIRSIRPCQY